MTTLLFYLFLALTVSFICSVLEAVLLSVPPSFISTKEAEGAKVAEELKKYKYNIDRPLSAILSLNTIAHTVGAAGVGAQAMKVFENVPLGVVSAILTFLILVLSEIIPKSIGARYYRELAIPSTYCIRVFIWVCYPLVWLSQILTLMFSKDEDHKSISREEVSAMVNMFGYY